MTRTELINRKNLVIFQLEMMNQTYNHDLFIEKLFGIDSKEAQYQMLRIYMLGLPIEEFDKFFFGNLAKIKQGITELSESGELTRDDRLDLLKSFDGFIAMAKSLQKPSVATST